MDFKVYYTDGSTFTGNPFDAPTMGCQIVLQRDKDNGVRKISVCDYYVWKPEGFWEGVDQAGLYQYLFRTGYPKQILFGELMRQEEWNELNRQANDDPDFVRYGTHALE